MISWGRRGSTLKAQFIAMEVMVRAQPAKSAGSVEGVDEEEGVGTGVCGVRHYRYVFFFGLCYFCSLDAMRLSEI